MSTTHPRSHRPARRVGVLTAVTAAVVTAAGALLPVAPAAAGARPAAATTGTTPSAVAAGTTTAPPCPTMRTAVLELADPRTRGSRLVTTMTQVRAAHAAGFTTNLGTRFYAASTAVAGTTPIHRVTRTTGDEAWVPEGAVLTARLRTGWADRGVAFHAVAGASSCRQVTSVAVAGRHRIATDRATLAHLLGTGGRSEGVLWSGAATPVVQPPDVTFSFAVMPDTQMETTNPTDTRFQQRTRWLVAHRAQLGLQFVLHTGDVVNWGWLAPDQYRIASESMRTLEQAGIPYALTIGNHDTRAVGWNGIAGSSGLGGSAFALGPACAPMLGTTACSTPLLVRGTQEFNDVFTAARYTHVEAVYEAGKVDNIATRYTAGGRSWLVLTLELWPREGVIDWARGVVAAHPRDAVIVQTHSYLSADGRIAQTNGGYGATSPQHLYDRLISQYDNIVMVFSGHTGAGRYRTDVRADGSRVYSFLQAFHSKTTDPVRIVTVNTTRGTVSSTIETPTRPGSLASYATPSLPLTLPAG